MSSRKPEYCCNGWEYVTPVLWLLFGIAVLQPLICSIGRGWFFTMLSLLSSLSGIGAVAALRRWGMGWRNLRRVGNDDTHLEMTVNPFGDIESHHGLGRGCKENSARI